MTASFSTAVTALTPEAFRSSSGGVRRKQLRPPWVPSPHAQQTLADMTSAPPANGSDADFKLIADSIPHIVWTTSRDGSTEYLNKAGRTYAGISADGSGV